MANPGPWPFDDDDRPSGSVRPLSQGDLQAILAHLDDAPPINCWPAPAPAGRWWQCGCGPAWASRAARPTVHGAQVPWGKVVIHGVPIVSARRLPNMLRALPGVLEPERVADLANRARVRFHPAA